MAPSEAPRPATLIAMDVTTEDLVAALRGQGLRVTTARRAVCGVLVGSHGEHLSAADIHERTQAAAGAAIDQSTVYRTLDTLEDAGLVTHTHMGHGALVYHLAEEAPHQHLVCSGCGRTIGVPATQLRRFFGEITRLTGFVADPTHVAFSGRCADCVASD